MFAHGKRIDHLNKSATATDYTQVDSAGVYMYGMWAREV
jgi:hypothetical protein